MALTSAQKTELKQHINESSDLNVYPNDGAGNEQIAILLNAVSSPSFTVWRTSVIWDEVMLSMDWARVDNLAVGKARIWDWMFQNIDRAFNPSMLNIRNGIDAVWVGTQADLNVRAAVYVRCKRLANRVENLFATGTGSDAVPAVLDFEGTVTYVDVEEARNS